MNVISLSLYKQRKEYNHACQQLGRELSNFTVAHELSSFDQKELRLALNFQKYNEQKPTCTENSCRLYTFNNGKCYLHTILDAKAKNNSDA